MYLALSLYVTENVSQFFTTFFFQRWIPRLAWTSPTFGPTPSQFTGKLHWQESRATESAIRRPVVDMPRMRGSPQPETTTL